MAKRRRILAVLVIAVALCAGRSVTAAPAAKPHLGPVAAARTLAGRIVKSLRQIVPSVRLDHARRAESAVVRTAVRPVAPALTVRIAEFSPFQFRLPPPLA